MQKKIEAKQVPLCDLIKVLCRNCSEKLCTIPFFQVKGWRALYNPGVSAFDICESCQTKLNQSCVPRGTSEA